MGDHTIFLFGLVVSAITLVGFVFTIIEMKRLGREADERAELKTGSAPLHAR